VDLGILFYLWVCAVAYLLEALCYKPEARGFDFYEVIKCFFPDYLILPSAL
jgi:hypothetical protein